MRQTTHTENVLQLANNKQLAHLYKGHYNNKYRLDAVFKVSTF